MPFLSKSTRIDRDDFDADHYADFIRDIHRSRLTLDQLDIAQRQFRRKEKFITHIHDLKMKEHDRIKNDFLRKLEQDKCLFNLSSVQETLKAQRRQRLIISSPINSPKSTKQIQKSLPIENHSKKTTTRPMTPRTERLKANLKKFNHTRTLLS